MRGGGSPAYGDEFDVVLGKEFGRGRRNRSSSGVLASPPELGGKPLQFHDVEESFLNRQFEILAK
jgi:hypothetical protein